jgi:triphosphoribosyl-dephospho-CoA synthase
MTTHWLGLDPAYASCTWLAGTGLGRVRNADSAAPELANLAVAALIDEADLTPKPALVDGRGSGAHHDLDLDRLRSSARALGDGFAAIALAAVAERPSLRFRAQVGRIGRDMEQRMLAATGGSNAHRGAIWALGLLVAAAARPGVSRQADSITAAAAALAKLPDLGLTTPRSPKQPLSHGQQSHLRYGASGARGEAQAGFPHAVHIGFPALRAARLRGVPEDHARLDALIAIMASLDDTCLLHRGGPAAVAEAKAGAQVVLDAGGTATPAGWRRLASLHDKLMARWASPGGSADLLAATLFLDRLEQSDGNSNLRV